MKGDTIVLLGVKGLKYDCNSWYRPCEHIFRTFSLLLARLVPSLVHWKKKWSHFDLKSWVTGVTIIQPGVPSNWRIFESNWLDIESQFELTQYTVTAYERVNLNLLLISSQFDSNNLQLLGIPGRILVPSVTQLVRSQWLHFFIQCLLFTCLLSHRKQSAYLRSGRGIAFRQTVIHKVFIIVNFCLHVLLLELFCLFALVGLFVLHFCCIGGFTSGFHFRIVIYSVFLKNRLFISLVFTVIIGKIYSGNCYEFDCFIP